MPFESASFVKSSVTAPSSTVSGVVAGLSAVVWCEKVRRFHVMAPGTPPASVPSLRVAVGNLTNSAGSS